MNLFVESVWWGHVERSGPSLFRWENYTSGMTPVELKYIIAPGSWVSDVRRAVAGDKPGLGGLATAEDPRTLVLTPSASPDPLFSPGDPITNPPGASPWHPTAFRARHFENYPGLMPGVSFESFNWGRVALAAGLVIRGPDGSLDAIRAAQKDGAPTYGCGVYVFAACQTAIRVRGPASQAGLEFWQPGGSPHKIVWAVKGGWPTYSALHADPATGDFVFEGGNLNHQQHGAVNLGGLCATATPAKNLRGIGAPVSIGATTLPIVFANAESDAVYGVMVECSWLTMKAVNTKTTAGFTVTFSVAAPPGATLDWLLVR
ncbi:MAG TPA: hypothetical protein VFK02_22350 [Kofleriaceae bacterium]|nr:hypothetical protein [Kofleriaceae bacterium]